MKHNDSQGENLESPEPNGKFMVGFESALPPQLENLEEYPQSGRQDLNPKKRGYMFNQSTGHMERVIKKRMRKNPN